MREKRGINFKIYNTLNNEYVDFKQFYLLPSLSLIVSKDKISIEFVFIIFAFYLGISRKDHYINI